MRIIVLENGITSGSPIRIKGCPVIFEQTGTSHLIALNQGIRDSTYPDTGNQPGILQTSQRPCIQADISVYQRGNTVGYNDSVASGSFNPVSSHHHMRMMDIVDKVFLLVYPNAAGEHIMHVIVADDNIMKMVLIRRTSGHRHINSGVPVHTLVYIPRSPVFTGNTADFTAFNHNIFCDPLRAAADADSLAYAAGFSFICHGQFLYPPMADAFQQNCRITSVTMYLGHPAFPIGFHCNGRPGASVSLKAKHAVPFSASAETDVVPRLKNHFIYLFQTLPGFLRCKTGTGIISVYTVNIKISTLFCHKLLFLFFLYSCFQ